MFHRVLSVAGGLCLAVCLFVPVSAFAQNNPPNPPPANQPAPAAASPDVAKVDEYAEAQHALSGPAGNPECVWLGRRVVSLLWRDDLDTAFRHLDLYDRFGCPSGHVQAAFRCLVLRSNAIDPKAPDSLNGTVQSCWINPTLTDPPPAASAAAPAPTATH